MPSFLTFRGRDRVGEIHLLFEVTPMQILVIQDQVADHHCWGCGALNKDGLHIKSYWGGSQATCTWQPDPRFTAGPAKVLHGGVICTISQCHSLATAVAHSYQQANRPIGSEPLIRYVPGGIQVVYRKPVPIHETVTLRARVTNTDDKKAIVACSLYVGDEEYVVGEVVAVRMPPDWLQER